MTYEGLLVWTGKRFEFINAGQSEVMKMCVYVHLLPLTPSLAKMSPEKLDLALRPQLGTTLPAFLR